MARKITREELLKHCLYYKGEKNIQDVPAAYNGKDEGKLWVAEWFACGKNHSDKYAIPQGAPHNNNPHDYLLFWVYAYVGKWAPRQAEQIINFYLKERGEI